MEGGRGNIFLSFTQQQEKRKKEVQKITGFHVCVSTHANVNHKLKSNTPKGKFFPCRGVVRLFG